MRVIDVHTHMLAPHWVEVISKHGGRFTMGTVTGGQKAVFQDGAPFMTLTPPMTDYDLRIADMDAAGIDTAIVSLTCPSVFWGGETLSAELSSFMNNDMAEAQGRFPGRIHFFATLPWEYPERAVAELKRAADLGAVGVMCLANIMGEPLTSPRLASIWSEIERLDLPVLVHPTTPPGADAMDMAAYNLIANIGFMFDTTLAFVRMIYDGFLDRFPNLKLIASHGGATLPYLVGRLDQCWDNMPACRVNTEAAPNAYLQRIWYDSVLYRPEALDLCLGVGGTDRVLYGSDYPHNIGDMAGVLSLVDALPDATRDAVRGGNALSLFRL
jgi:aminocarboxymuconate-semialdehyde decarboxylase